MDTNTVVEKLLGSLNNVPPEVKIYAVRQYSLDELHRRARHLMALATESYDLPFSKGDWVEKQDRTLIHLPRGGRAVVFHASGAMKLVTGLKPMEEYFPEFPERGRLVEMLKHAADRLRVDEWTKNSLGRLEFERLWQIKAAAADRNNKTVAPILCRAIGAFRHFVADLPVWGAASVSVSLAAEGALDSLTLQIREPTEEVVDQARILPPKEAARQIVLQLSTQMGSAENHLEFVKPQWFQFGYLSLTKRKTQRVLAPAYIASIAIEGKHEKQASLFAIPATEKTYLPLCRLGSDAPPSPLRCAADDL